MAYTLGTNIKKGQQINTSFGWRKVKEVSKDGAVVKEGLIKFGETIFGWKAN